MSIALRRVLGFVGLALALPAAPVLAQTEATPQVTMTIEGAKAYLHDAGLQACEVNRIDPAEAPLTGALVSLSIGVALDCGAYDPQNPTVVNVHQFADRQSRDAMVASLQNLRFRALQAYGDVWVVDDFVVVLLGPQRAEVGALLKAEYKRRHPEEG
jgi:hypothetical protein